MNVYSMELYSNDARVARFNLSYGVVNPSDITTHYKLTAATGLDAEELQSRWYGANSETNEGFYDLSLGVREVALSIELDPVIPIRANYSLLRDALYSAISSNRTGMIELRFNNEVDSVIGVLVGRVSKFESDLFSNKPNVTITIRCDDPLIQSNTYTTRSPDVLSTDGFIDLYDTESNAPHGFKLRLNIDVATSFVMLKNEGLTEWLFLVNYPFTAGDVLYFSSEYRNKYLYVVKPWTQIIQLVDKIALGSIWPIMFPGLPDGNIYAVALSAGGDYTWVNASWRKAYWGV